jgi:hypothetical protein
VDSSAIPDPAAKTSSTTSTHNGFDDYFPVELSQKVRKLSKVLRESIPKPLKERAGALISMGKAAHLPSPLLDKEELFPSDSVSVTRSSGSWSIVPFLRSSPLHLLSSRSDYDAVDGWRDLLCTQVDSFAAPDPVARRGRRRRRIMGSTTTSRLSAYVTGL